MKKQLLYLLAAVAVAATVFVTGCQKELSFEGSGTPAKGDLQDDVTGDCLPKTVNGIYSAGAALVPATNTITVQVNVTQTGTYVVTTDTVNGYFFRATGTFTALGITTVTLRGNGTPFAAGTNNFIVSFDGTICDIAVDVLPAGTGAAVFTLASGGTPPNCANAVVSGTYTQNIALTPLTNFVDISVNVTTLGSYTITATGGGMTFSKSGAFTAIGTQVVRLDGNGTPTGAAGPTTITFTIPAAFATCSFTVTVLAGAGPATFTLVSGGAPVNCASAVVTGTYTQNVALVAASNYVDITVNVSTIGSYTITAAGGGMIFSKSGTFTATGNQTVRLDGSNTPTGSGAVVVPFTTPAAFSSCSFTVTVAAAGGPCQGTLDVSGSACAPITVNGSYYIGTALTAANNVVVQIDVTQAGTYSITASSAGAGFGFSASGSVAVGTNQPITLNFTGGPPTTVGAHTFTVTFGTSTCTFVVNVLSTDYFPRTTNSNWSYEIDDVATDSLLRTATSNTITAPAVGGNAFTIFMHNDGVTPQPDSGGYYRRNGGDYFEWFNWANYLGGITSPAWAEYIMVKDNLAAGTPAWKTGATQVTTATGTIYLRFSYRIEQKDVPITVVTSLGSATYQNVIVVEEKIDGSADGITWQDISGASGLDFYGKSYYARGIGLIMYQAFDASNAPLFKQELRRSQVF